MRLLTRLYGMVQSKIAISYTNYAPQVVIFQLRFLVIWLHTKSYHFWPCIFATSGQKGPFLALLNTAVSDKKIKFPKIAIFGSIQACCFWQ